MRVFTKKETATFDMAYKCISRVVACTYSTENLYEIKVQNRETKYINPLPTEITDMFYKAGIPYMQNLFCDINKNKAIAILQKKFLKDGTQPTRYFIDGLLVIQKVKYETTNFVDMSARVAS